MYKNIYYNRKTNKLHVWDDKVGHYQIDYKKYAYIKSPSGKYKALDGSKVEKIYSWDSDDEERRNIYESDIRPEVRYLIDTYYATDDVSENLTTLYLDIEVAKEGKYSTSWDANNKITSFALYDDVTKLYRVLLLDPERRLSNRERADYILEVFDTERDLLLRFLAIYREIDPDIITHWNGDKFDIPYIYNRIKKVLGDNFAKLLSPVGEIVLDKIKQRYKIAGRSNLDYMFLYKAFTYNEEPSYALEAISQKELGEGKIKYEGTLDDFFRNDPEGFIEYNLNDIKLIIKLENKLKFLNLARNICHKGHVPYEDVFSSVRYLDGACLTYLKRLGIIAPNKAQKVDEVLEFDDLDKDKDDDEGFSGAFVKDPIPGLYEWVFDEDLKALYPSCQRGLNMSPETKIGRLDTWDLDAFINNDETFSYKFKSKTFKGLELRKYLIDKNYSISAIGVIYDLNNKGLVPSILEIWAQEREDYRALAKKFGKAGNEEMYRFYDSRQLTMKILSNSLYGVLGNVAFRFYDLDGAESTTTSGKEVVKHKAKIANIWFNEKLGTEDVDYVIYIDTDSTFFSALPLIKMMEEKLNRTLTYEECVEFTFKTSLVIENHVNDTFTEFAKKYFNITNHFFETKQEYVAETAFWIKKKRYAQKIISEKGTLISVLTEGKKQFKLDVKGLDVVRSSFPKAFRGFMSEILLDILNKADMQSITDKVFALKEKMPELPMYDIMTNASVKEISKYDCKPTGGIFKSRPKGMPIHVKSAANYNDLLTYYNLEQFPVIDDGDKIKWCYLRQNKFGIETLGLTGYDDALEILKFITENISYERIFEASLLNKLDAFYAARGWGEVPANNMVQNFFEF